MPVSRRRVPKERPPQKRNGYKALMQRAMIERCRSEREALLLHAEGRLGHRITAKVIDGRIVSFRGRANDAEHALRQVPSIFFAEKIDSDYKRPLWASHQYGAN